MTEGIADEKLTRPWYVIIFPPKLRNSERSGELVPMMQSYSLLLLRNTLSKLDRVMLRTSKSGFLATNSVSQLVNRLTP